VVGERSPGHATSQVLYDLDTLGPPKAAPRIGVVNVTAVHQFGADGRRVQGRGVMPEIELPWHAGVGLQESGRSFATPGEDLPLAKFARFPLGITDDLVARLRESSENRRSAAPEFERLQKSRERLAAMEANGVPLNRDAIRARVEARLEDEARLSRWKSEEG